MKLIFLLILALAIKGLNNHEQDMNHSLLKRMKENIIICRKIDWIINGDKRIYLINSDIINEKNI